MKDPIQEEIIDEFSVFEDWLSKYDYIIELADDLTLIDPSKRTDEYAIRGCQSKVWVDSRMEDGKMYFSADSNAIITKGIIALLIRVYDGLTPDELIGKDLYFIDAIGLGSNLSPTRANGLRAMIEQMRMFAVAYKAQANK